MANKKSASRKKPVSQKRVAVVLASLVGALTISAGLLLLMEGGSLNAGPMAAAIDHQAAIASSIEPTSSLQPGRWNYIIIYESADPGASRASLADGSLTGGQPLAQRMVRPGANFHFVIDSASSGNGMDGELEVGTAWQSQEAGAPYAGWPNPRYHNFTPYNNAVGICLSADLNQQPVSEAQHQTLVQLVSELQHRLNIPNNCVLFQWDERFKAVNATPAQKAYADSVRFRLEHASAE